MLVYNTITFTATGSANSPITLPAGQTSVIVPLNVHKHGKVYRVLVKQSSGTNVAFNVDLYDGPVTGTGAFERDICRIFARQVISAGNTCLVSSENGLAYRNKLNEDKLYLEISIGTSQGAPITFIASITWATPDS